LVINPIPAADYRPYLVNWVFDSSDGNNYNPVKGDITVFNRSTKHPYGHIQMYNGHRWVSDFRQNNFSPYRITPSYRIYRWNSH